MGRSPRPTGREGLYRLLVENVTDYAIILLEPDGRIATWTEGAERMFGHPEEDALGRPFAVLYPADEVAEGRPERDLHAALRDGRWETTAWRVRSDGAPLWVSVVLTAIHDASGRAIGLGQITRDLTERKEVAERYEESRQRYRSLFENNPDGVCSLDLDGTVRSANPAAEALVGYDADDLRSTAFWALAPPEERECVRASFAAAAAGEPVQAESALVHRAGHRVPVRLTLVPIAVRQGIAGVYCIAQDIGERLRGQAERESLILRERIARGEAEAASRAKGDFLAVVSHELRTPLNAILNYTDLLLEEEAGAVAEEQRRHLRRVRDNAERLTGLVDDILGFARLDGGPAVRLEPVEVAGVAAEILDELRDGAEVRGLALELVPPAAVLRAETDPARLRELLRALLTNAVKFTEEGSVRVCASGEGRWVAVRVEDTGIGFDPADAGRIWEPFWQAESPRVRRAGGTGLGLSIARRLAARLGGELDAESVPGEGSIFTLRLPASP